MFDVELVVVLAFGGAAVGNVVPFDAAVDIVECGLDDDVVDDDDDDVDFVN